MVKCFGQSRSCLPLPSCQCYTQVRTAHHHQPEISSALTIETGSQLPLYFTGGTLTFIAEDLNAHDVIGWLPVANTLAIASVCPFVGYLQDLFGKRYIALFGALLLCLGCIVLGTAHHLGAALAGMALAGAGAGIGELTGLAG